MQSSTHCTFHARLFISSSSHLIVILILSHNLIPNHFEHPAVQFQCGAAVDLISCARNWDFDWLLLLDFEQITIHSGFQFHYKCKNAKWQAGHYLRDPGRYGMVWYGMSWNGMAWDVCLSVDRWSLWPPMIKFCVSFEAYMRKCLWSPHLTPPTLSSDLLLQQLHSQIGANAFEFVWPAAKSIDNQSAPVQFGQPSCQFAQSAHVHPEKLRSH